MKNWTNEDKQFLVTNVMKLVCLVILVAIYIYVTR